jgi:hypothetical protein
MLSLIQIQIHAAEPETFQASSPRDNTDIHTCFLSFSQAFVSHKGDLSSHTNQAPSVAHGAVI